MKNKAKSNFLSHLNLYSSHIDALLEKIDILLEKEKRLHVVFTPNPEQIVLAQKDKRFAEVLCQADTLIPDGVGVVLASRLFSLVNMGDAITARIPGVELVEKILHQAEVKRSTVMVIGGKAYNNLRYKNWHVREFQEKKSQKKSQSESKNVLWWRSGYEDVMNPRATEHTALLSCIQSVAPDILFVAFGAPAQEKWVIEHKAVLEKAGVRLVMVVGGAFDMLLGKVERAPQWMRSIGLEWLYRLIQEPWRWKRQIALITFMKLVFQDLMKPR